MLELKNELKPVVFSSDEIAEAWAHIETQWGILTRDQKIDEGTLIGLPYPYVVPSVESEDGFSFQEMYYWDNYFLAQGLIRTGRQELAEGILEDLIYLIKRLHIVPNASRYYLSGRSQPPFLTSLVFDLYDLDEKSDAWLREHIAFAIKEYQTVWLGTEQPNIRNVYKNLSRYYDINVLNDLAEAESGWDYTTRYGGKCLSYVPICLNSLLYKYETDFARAFTIFKDPDTADVWKAKAQRRAETINSELWSDERGFYFDLNYEDGSHSPVWSLAGYYPMWAGLATAKQAQQLVDKLHLFLYEGGLATTASPHDTFDNRSFSKQWAYPNGWAPLHWLVVQGLVKYGYHEEADLIARRWIKTNLDYFKQFKIFREAYNVVNPLDTPVEGVYPAQIGFGWTNAIFVDLCKQFLNPDELLKV